MLTITLGQLIEKLESFPQQARIDFDFCDLIPTNFLSWRGNYSELALGFALDSDDESTVAKLLEKAKSTLGKQFEGYKGGCYMAKPDTLIYVDNWGQCSSTLIIDIRLVYEEWVKIITRHETDY